MDINVVVVSGRLTRDAEVRRTASGMAIVSFGIAVNDRRKNQQTGEWEDVPNFIDVTWFGQYAEKCSGSLGKGTGITVKGKLRQSSWEREGQKRSKVEIVADEVVMPPRSSQGAYQPRASQPQSYEQTIGEEIPF